MSNVKHDSEGKFAPKKLTILGKTWRIAFLSLIAFDMVYTGVVLTGIKFPESKTIYKANEIIVTNEKAEFEAKWLQSDQAKNLAEHEYLLAKKAEVEKELDSNRSLSLK